MQRKEVYYWCAGKYRSEKEIRRHFKGFDFNTPFTRTEIVDHKKVMAEKLITAALMGVIAGIVFYLLTVYGGVIGAWLASLTM